jgi:hypothetical protein
MSTIIQKAIEQADLINDDRLSSYPDSIFFKYARNELTRIKNQYYENGYIDKKFYDSINIGVMCARELESVDPDYCNIIYNMLEEIRIGTLT